MAQSKKSFMEKKNDENPGKITSKGQPVPLRIAYIGGGSRGWAHILIRDLLRYPGFTGEVRLYDIDRPMAEFNARFGNWMQHHPEAASKWKYRAVASLKTALKDADFVFVSILPGPIEMMKLDLEEPQKYGVFHSVGDTVGPAGCIRAFRAVRDYRKIAEAIARCAPKAWTLSFSNPMTVCTRTLYETFPDIKAYGCCHEVFGTKRMLRDMYASMTKEEKPSLKEIDVNVLGVNHFTWINRAKCRGGDLLELLREYMGKPGVIRKYKKKEVESHGNVFIDHDQVKFELYRRFGILAAAGDRHLAEFVPWFLTSRDSCYRWGFMLTPYSYRKERYDEAPKEFRRMMDKKEFPPLLGSGEEYLDQMIAITANNTLKTNVNLPNRGQVQGLPEGAVVETNAVFSENSVDPVASGRLPDNVNILVRRHTLNQESIVKAVFENDKRLAFQAFLNDPLVTISIDDAWKLFNDMLKKTGFEFKK